MRWDDGSLAGFARQAGWQGGDTALAVAVCLATSNGDDSYSYRPPFNLPGHFVGLWGVDADTFPEFDATLLGNPAYNAASAYTVWKRLGKTWGWNPAYNSGRYQQFAKRAAVAVTSPSATQYGFGLDPSDIDSRDLAAVAWSGTLSTISLENVVRGL